MSKQSAIPTLEPDELAAIYRRLTSRNVTPTRALAMLRLMEATGLRVGEVIALRPESLEPDGDLVRVQVPNEAGCKTGSRRVSFLATNCGNPTQTWAAIERWSVLRAAIQRDTGTSEPYLFLSNRGGKVDRASFCRYVPRVAREAGLTRRVTVHMWRHTAITKWARELPVAVVANQAGHSSIAMTMRYVHMIDDDRDRLARAFPV